MALSTWLNNIIRIDVALSEPLSLTPPAPTQSDKDHFFEIQHIVALLMTPQGSVTEGNVFQIPLGFFIDLASFISGQQNLFLISRAQNAAKRSIPWAQYAPGAQPRVLLDYFNMGTAIPRKDACGRVLSPAQGTTVGQTVEGLARKMARRTGEYSFLTRQVGQLICGHMGWLPEGRFTPVEHRQLNDWELQVWQNEMTLNGRDRRGMGSWSGPG